MSAAGPLTLAAGALIATAAAALRLVGRQGL